MISDYVFKKIENNDDSSSIVLLASLLNKRYNTRETFKKAVNNFIEFHNYAIMIRRFNVNRKNKLIICYLKCTRNSKFKKNKNKNKRNAKFQRIECSFQIVDKFKNNS